MTTAVGAGGTSTNAGRLAKGVDGTNSSNRVLVTVVVQGAEEMLERAQNLGQKKG